MTTTTTSHSEGKCTYRLFYKGKTEDVKANSAFEAQEAGKRLFKIKNGWNIAVVLLAVEDKQVEHSPDF